MCSTTKEYEYFVHTVKFLYIKLALKYLTLDMMDDAIYLAIKTNIPEIVSHCRNFANAKKDVAALSLLEYHDEKTDGDAAHRGGPARQVNLARALSQVANFTKRVLKKEDYLNLYKDFDTLLKIDDISDLELTDFNGWEFNLEQYQKGLEHELAGEFDEALKIYSANKIHGDIERVKALKAEIYKEIRDGEKNLVVHNVKDVFIRGST